MRWAPWAVVVVLSAWGTLRGIEFAIRVWVERAVRSRHV